VQRCLPVTACLFVVALTSSPSFSITPENPSEARNFPSSDPKVREGIMLHGKFIWQYQYLS
jgi:hypothetical protein